VIWRGGSGVGPIHPTVHTVLLYTLSLKFDLFEMSLETITTISPVTNKPILTRNGLSASDLELLPQVATEAFLSFRKTTLAERQAIVKKALELLGDRQDELAKELTEQMGRPIAYTAKEVSTAVKRGEYLLKISEDTLKDTEGEAENGFKRFIRKVPVGPVLVLFAWNASHPLISLLDHWLMNFNSTHI
jgi:acyl-CoA reductase-like NAD-dependent aldehyde dehydrogenase